LEPEYALNGIDIIIMSYLMKKTASTNSSSTPTRAKMEEKGGLENDTKNAKRKKKNTRSHAEK
jgi:hypothetical protein